MRYTLIIGSTSCSSQLASSGKVLRLLPLHASSLAPCSVPRAHGLTEATSKTLYSCKMWVRFQLVSGAGRTCSGISVAAFRGISATATGTGSTGMLPARGAKDFKAGPLGDDVGMNRVRC